MAGYRIFVTSPSAPAQQFSDILLGTTELLSGIVLTWNEDLAEVGFRFDGLAASGAVLVLETSANYNATDPTWVLANVVSSAGVWSTYLTADGDYRVGVTSKTAIRVRVSTTGTGFVVATTATTEISTLANLSIPAQALSVGNASFSTGQVTVAASATAIVAARAGRGAVTIVNHGTIPVIIGDATVTTSTGVLLAGIVGASITISTSANIYGIVASGTQLVSYAEIF